MTHPGADPDLIAKDLARIRERVGGPGECHCTGACEAGPQFCPAYGAHLRTFNELVEDTASITECFGNHERAAALRAGKDPE